jgi:hypothetical protein
MADVRWSNKGNLIHAGNGREFRLPEIPNLKVDGFVVRLMISLSNWGVSGTGVRPASPVETSPSAIVRNSEQI